jgi:hypothetical protein
LTRYLTIRGENYVSRSDDLAMSVRIEKHPTLAKFVTYGNADDAGMSGNSEAEQQEAD